MMKLEPCVKAQTHSVCTPPSQRGGTLFEALIAIFLLGIVVLGITLVAARTLNTQRFAATQNAVVQQMRNQIQELGIDHLCHSATQSLAFKASTKDMQIPVDISCTNVAVRVGVANDGRFTVDVTPSVPRIQLRTVSGDADLNQLIGAGSISITQ